MDRTLTYKFSTRLGVEPRKGDYILINNEEWLVCKTIYDLDENKITLVLSIKEVKKNEN
jgi:hypothetical protein